VTESTATASSNAASGAGESLTVRDNRTGQEYDLPIVDGAVRAADLGKIKAGEDVPGLAVYDPGFVNTASCRSAVTFIDGDKGILEYRGYPIEQLADAPAGHLRRHVTTPPRHPEELRRKGNERAYVQPEAR
jgi:citrate synthase